MSVREIILDKVKDRLFEVLHGIPLTEKILHSRDGKRIYGDSATPTVCEFLRKPPLKKWDIDYATNIIDFTIDSHEQKIRDIINSTLSKQKNPSLRALNDDLIDQIVEKIIPLTLVLDDQQRAHYFGQNFPTQNPIFPFNIRSLIQMCWGLTLNISSESVEQTLGGIINAQFGDQFKQIVSVRLATNIDDTTNIFLMNLQMTMSGTIRNLGLIRQAHTEYLALNGDRLSVHRKNLEQVADFSSFSGSGLFAKLGSFVGFGSVSDLVTAAQPTTTMTNPILPWVWIPVFIIGGIIGSFVVTFAARAYVDRTDDSWDRKVKQDQNRYWREHYKRDVTNELYNFYVAIIGLIDRFYPDQQRDEIMCSDEMLYMRPNPEFVKTIIYEDVIAPNELQWFPVVATQTSSLNIAAQTSPTPSASKPTTQPTNDKSGKSS